MLLRVGEETLSPSLLYVRKGLEIVSQGIAWISPFSYLTRALQAIDIGSIRLHSVLFSVVYSLVFLVFSVLILERKGVRG